MKGQGNKLSFFCHFLQSLWNKLVQCRESNDEKHIMKTSALWQIFKYLCGRKATLTVTVLGRSKDTLAVNRAELQKSRDRRLGNNGGGCCPDLCHAHRDRLPTM